MDPRAQRMPVNPPQVAVPAERAMLESREPASRKPFVYKPAGELPEVIKHSDWTARWVRFRMPQGQADQSNVSKKMRDHFRFVTFENRAEVLVDPDSVISVPSGNIEIGDVVLMRRAREISTARNKYYENVTRDQIRGAKNEVKKAEIPGKNYGKISDDSTTEFTTPKAKEVSFGED